MLWDDLVNKNINNKYIGTIKSSILFGIDIDVPNIQRIKDSNKIDDIINYQLNYFKERGIFNYLGTINIHFCDETKLYYLVDGQHRFESLKKMYNEMGHNIDIFVEIVCVKTYEELKSNYNIINKNTPLPDFPESIDKLIPEKAAEYFKLKYPTIWSKNSRSRRPHLYFNFFQEALGIITDKLELNDVNKLINIIEEYNQKLKNWNISEFPNSKDINESMKKKCEETNFYLGLFKHVSDEYAYKWVQTIIYNEKGMIIKEKKRNCKKKIPQKIRIDSWNKFVGEDIKKAPCICCRTKIIDSFDFQAGHIISEKNGGNISIDNIIPICSGCNQSMGIKNMGDFIKEYYPKNETFFINRDYSNNNCNLSLFGH